MATLSLDAATAKVAAALRCCAPRGSTASPSSMRLAESPLGISPSRDDE